jgi:hypothetical protein|tara:strand:- start:724 stop:1245 length:522 start_codon:yes stop_codon:yes gene_type:complete
MIDLVKVTTDEHIAYMRSIFEDGKNNIQNLVPDYENHPFPTDIMYILYDDDVPVGLSTLTYEGVYGSLDLMYVERKYRDLPHKRYGQHIVWKTIEIARGLNLTEVYFYLDKNDRIYSSMIRKNRTWDNISIKTDASELPKMVPVNPFKVPEEAGIRKSALYDWETWATLKMDV